MRKSNSSQCRPGIKKVIRPSSTKSTLSKSSPRLHGRITSGDKSILFSKSGGQEMESRGSATILEGTLRKNGRVLNYMIRENPSTGFVISLFVVTTKQKWSLYVPFSETIMELLRLWRIAPRYSNRSMIGTWLLSCSNIEFSHDIIINAGFDHVKFSEKCVAHLITFINIYAIKIQSVVRMFLACQYVRHMWSNSSKKQKFVTKRSNCSHHSRRQLKQIRVHHIDNSDYSDEDDRSISTKYSHENPFLDAGSVNTQGSHHSHSSSNSIRQQPKSRTVDWKADTSTIRERCRREQEVVAVYANPVSRTSHSTTKPRRAQLKGSKDAMQYELRNLREDIGNVLIGFQEELKDVKKSVEENFSSRVSFSSRALAGPNNVINEVSSICEAEIQPVKDMMKQVLQDINSLRENKTSVTPALLAAERNAETLGNFSADISGLVAQMAELQRQMSEQEKYNTAARVLASTTQADSKVVHESVLKAYKEKVMMLEKSETEKITRIAALNFQLRRACAAVSSQESESRSELLTTKAALEQANSELDALRITLSTAENEVTRLKYVIANKSGSSSSRDVLNAGYQDINSELQAAKACIESLQKEKKLLIQQHEDSLRVVTKTLDSSRDEVYSLKESLAQVEDSSGNKELKCKLQEMTSKLASSNTKISHLEDELKLTKMERLRLSDKLVQSRGQTQDFSEIEENLRETIDTLDKKLLESCDKQYRLQCKLESKMQAHADEMTRSLEKQKKLSQTVANFEEEVSYERAKNEVLRQALRDTEARLEYQMDKKVQIDQDIKRDETRLEIAERVAKQALNIFAESEAKRELEHNETVDDDAARAEEALRADEEADRLAAEEAQREAAKWADEVARLEGPRLTVVAAKEREKAEPARLNGEGAAREAFEETLVLPVAAGADNEAIEAARSAAEDDAKRKEWEKTEQLARTVVAREAERESLRHAKVEKTDESYIKSNKDIVNPRVAELLVIIGETQDPNIIIECIAVAVAESSSALILKTFARINYILGEVLSVRPKSVMKVVQKIFPDLSVITVTVRHFSAIVAFQNAALDMILSLLRSSFAPGIAQEFSASGIMEGFIVVLTVHSDRVDLCLRALQGCQVMLECYPASQVQLGTREFGDAIAALLTVHNNDTTIMKSVAQVLLPLCKGCLPVVYALGETAIAEALVVCLSLQQHNIALCRLLVAAIVSLCPKNNDVSLARFGTTQTYEVFMNALSRNRGVDGLFADLCSAIIGICDRSEGLRLAIPGVLFASTMIDIFGDSGTPQKNIKAGVKLLYFLLANESLRNDIIDSGMDETLAKLEVSATPSLADAIGSCRRRMSGLTSISRSSSTSSILSADLSIERLLRDSSSKFSAAVVAPTVVDKISGSTSSEVVPSGSLATTEDPQPKDATAMEYSKVVESALLDRRSGTEKVRGTTLKLMSDKKKNRDNMRLVALMQGMSKIYDPAIMTEIYQTSVEMNNRDMCLNSLRRTDDIIKEAKAAKTYSPLVTSIIGNPMPFLTMLQHFLRDAEVQTVGLLTITWLSYAGGGIEVFGSTKCFQHIYNVMKTHGTNRDVMLFVLALAGRLTAKNQANKLHASENGGFDILVSTMRRFETDSAVLDKLCRYICSCTSQAPANADAFREAGGCQLLLKLILSASGSGGDIAEALNVTVLNLCSQSTINQTFFASSGCMKLYFKEMATAITKGSALKFKLPCKLIFALLKFPHVSLVSLLKVKAPAKFMMFLEATADKDILVLTLVLIQSLCEFESLQVKFAELRLVDTVTKLTEGGKNSILKKYCDAVVTSMMSKARAVAPTAVEST